MRAILGLGEKSGGREGRPGGPAFAIGSIALLLALTPLLPNVWWRMAAFYAITTPFALLATRPGWAVLLVPGPGKVASGAIAAVALYLLAGAGFRLVGAISPSLAARASALYAWKDQVSFATAALLSALLIIPGEEIVWRGAVLRPLAARYGPRAGIGLGALAFAAAHLAFGSPLLLLAAVGCGTFWGWLTLKTRSLVPAIVCHLLWDFAVLFVRPYGTH